MVTIITSGRDPEFIGCMIFGILIYTGVVEKPNIKKPNVKMPKSFNVKKK